MKRTSDSSSTILFANVFAIVLLFDVKIDGVPLSCSLVHSSAETFLKRMVDSNNFVLQTK